jgi:hypothetical protein
MWTCDFQGCSSKPFKRQAELIRHQLKHEDRRGFSCLARDCKRVGARGFTRVDKLTDHVLAGHEEDELFDCTKPGCTMSLSRDLISIHHKDYSASNGYRQCPMPKCSFRICAGRKSMDLLQSHMLQQHDTKGRTKFGDLLLRRGYHPSTLEIICPVCPLEERFQGHTVFYQHFLEHHLRQSHNLARLSHLSMMKGHHDNLARKILTESKTHHDVVFQQRRTILSLWPDFEKYSVWDDLRC